MKKMKKTFTKIAKRALTLALCIATFSSVSTLTTTKTNAAEHGDTIRHQQLGKMYQYPQERYYWCGYSALQTLVNNECLTRFPSWYFEFSQSTIASYLYNNINYFPNPYTNGNELGQWYGGDYFDPGSEEHLYYMPAVKMLRDFCGANYWAANHSISRASMTAKLHSSLNNGHGVMMCGSGDALNGQYYDGHWIAIDGYRDYSWGEGTYFIVDPAGQSPALSYGPYIKRYYAVKSSQLYNYFNNIDTDGDYATYSSRYMYYAK